MEIILAKGILSQNLRILPVTLPSLILGFQGHPQKRKEPEEWYTAGTQHGGSTAWLVTFGQNSVT